MAELELIFLSGKSHTHTFDSDAAAMYFFPAVLGAGSAKDPLVKVLFKDDEGQVHVFTPNAAGGWEVIHDNKG